MGIDAPVGAGSVAVRWSEFTDEGGEGVGELANFGICAIPFDGDVEGLRIVELCTSIISGSCV